ncbi:MAG: chorismate synthase [Planctomycetota bacterium]
MSNTFGDRLRITTWGESHGPAVGAVIDGCPAGLAISVAELEAELARDVPDPAIGTPRREPNRVEILSGVFAGRTLGSPVSLLIRNEDVCSDGYFVREQLPRPGHADLSWRQRYGHVDPRGGGRASGRECIARLAAGVVAKKLLLGAGVSIGSRVTELAGIAIETEDDRERAHEEVRRVGKAGDSTGGTVSVTAEGLPPGIGAPVFGKLTARVGQALLSIGGVKGVEFGEGFSHARLRGSESNDPIVGLENGDVRPATNRAGGTLGGISTGLPLRVVLAVKPTPSVRREQDTVDLGTGEPARVSGKGRFDMNFAPRVAVIAESMLAFVVADALLESGHIHPTRVS